MEPFRDDESALRARVVELEHELDDLHKQIAGAGGVSTLPTTMAKMLDEEKHALAQARLELSRVNMNPRRGNASSKPVMTLFAVIVLGLALVIYLVGEHQP